LKLKLFETKLQQKNSEKHVNST